MFYKESDMAQGSYVGINMTQLLVEDNRSDLYLKQMENKPKTLQNLIWRIPVMIFMRNKRRTHEKIKTSGGRTKKSKQAADSVVNSKPE
jgi:hypothetical protein